MKLLILIVGLSFPAAALGQGAAGGAAPPPDPATRLKLAVDKLLLEAKDLDNFGKIANPLVFTRPHPLLKNFSPQMATLTLDRMIQPFTNNEYRDTYIRWHLIWVLNKTPVDQRRSTGPRLVALARLIPGPLNISARVESYWDPDEIYRKYLAMVLPYPGSPALNVVVGYPPFQRTVGAPESFKYADAAAIAAYKQAVLDLPRRQEEYRKRVEAADKLYGGKFKNVRDEGAIAFNQRLYQMQHIVRHYRGEVIYTLIQSGDAETGKMAMAEIGRLAKARNPFAFDFLAYVYVAAFDGALNLYDQSALEQMSQILKEGAIASEGYTSYAGQQRNFADSAFHLIEMLKDGGGFIEPEHTGK